MIPLYKPYISDLEAKFVNKCLETTWISSKGEFIEQFERGFADYIRTQYATTVCNGSVAIHLALLALGIGPGDEVLVPSLTYIASVNSIIQTGATPIFVDSLESTWQIDPDDVRRNITKKTKAIMVVHLYGLPCDMSEIVLICNEYKILLVEDCAEAIGSKYNERHVGTFGDVATFSFYGNKTITTGEGGMVVSKNKLIHDKVYHLKTQGVSTTQEYWHDILAYNYRMTNICAAIGLAQLHKIEEILIKKRQIADWYREGLQGLPLVFHNEPGDTYHSYWLCSLAVQEAEIRQSLRENLKQAGIETRPFFYPAHTLPHCSADKSLPVAESLSKRGINLPSYPGLERREVDQITRSIRSFFESGKMS